MSRPDFWNDQKQANETIVGLKRIKTRIEPFKKTWQEYNDLKELSSLVEETDKESLAEIEGEIAGLEENLKKLELETTLGEEDDRKNAIFSIHAGAGGTEACDWVEMLLRMYLKWVARRGYSVQQIDFLPGEEAGLKNVTLIIKGDYAYGYLKSERGVHRLVRISPFDSNKRRHTSFASCDVMPEVTDEVKVEIKDEDLRIDVFRSSGPGGQGVNTTDSAVRITHLATGIVVQCPTERSQHKNKATAMKVLKARLYERQRKEQEEKLAARFGQKDEIAWGSQIRSYVFHPYSMVKDHRTNAEVGSVQKVMDGEIDPFIEAYLKTRKKPVTGN